MDKNGNGFPVVLSSIENPKTMRKTAYWAVVLLLLAATACQEQNQTQTAMSKDLQEDRSSGSWEDLYEKIDPSEIPDNPIQLIGQEWMLVTAGNAESFNTMTASWGGLGVLWSRPAAFIFVRDSRYTFQFLQSDSCFTMSFYPEEYRPALQICGTKSGRDGDKIKEAGLTALESPSGNMAFAQARMILECRKMFCQRMDRGNFQGPYGPAITKKYYPSDDPSDHFLFVGEIVNVWVKRDPLVK